MRSRSHQIAEQRVDVDVERSGDIWKARRLGCRISVLPVPDNIPANANQISELRLRQSSLLAQTGDAGMNRTSLLTSHVLVVTFFLHDVKRGE